ncbi:MAG: glycosyltransferase family 4 protein [archaeon]
MKIALVTPYFPPNIGGIETYVYELAKRLSKHHDVYVFTCGRGMTETYGNVKVFRMKAIDIQNLPFPIKIPYPIPLSLMFKLAKFDVDIIHVHGHAFFTSLEAAVAARIVHKPLILTIHDVGVSYHDYLIMRGVRPLFDTTVVNYIFSCANAVVAQNRVTYDYASRFNPKKMRVIPQAVNFEKFKPCDNDGEYVTFIAARLVPQKGGEAFIRTIPKVLSAVKGTKFLVIGDGIQKDYLKDLASKLGILKNVTFVGKIAHDDVPKYLSRTKVAVFTSEIPTGLTLLEAAAMKRPIITTKNRWAEDSLGDTPVFVSTSRIDEISGAIIHLLKHPDERRRVAERVYNKVTLERNWDNLVLKHMELYDQVVNRRSQSMKRGINE